MLSHNNILHRSAERWDFAIKSCSYVTLRNFKEVKKVRKSKVKPLVAEYAISLRREGVTYNEIVVLCNQIDKTKSITLDWCKKMLKDIQIQSTDVVEDACMKQITSLAQLPKGVTYFECCKIIAHNHKINMLTENDVSVYELYKKYKAKVCKIEGTLFRPSSIQPDKARQSLKKLVANANYLYDCVADVVDDYCREYPETYPSAVRREIASILFPELKLMGGGVARCAYLENAVNALSERVKQQEEMEVCYIYNQPDFVFNNTLPF